MKILSVSDCLSGELIAPDQTAPVANVELIVGCGDLPPEYLASLRVRYDVPLFYVLGNHDIRHQTPPPGCLNITGRIITYKGLHFLGFSGSRWYNGNQNQFREREMQAQIRRLWFRLWRLRRPLDLVVTHAPPRYIHDAEDRCHKGFKCYRRFIDRYRPRFFIHGHIHTFFDKPADRISTVGQTQVINSYGYHVFEI